MTDVPHPTTAADVHVLGGDLPVHRLGYGAMRITGSGIWGDPPDRDSAKAVLRRALELGVNLIDTADSYGPEVSELLIAEALHPYPADLVIATKAGLLRDGPGQWRPDCRPSYLRGACEASLRRLRLERIDLYQLHTVDPQVPIEESVGALVELQGVGLVRHIGVCNVSADQLARARAIVDVVSVQNRYNLADRTSDDLVDACEREGLAFLPWFPLATGELAAPGAGSTGLPRHTARLPLRSRSPGCWRGPRRCCRFRAPARSSTWRRIWGPPSWTSRPTISPPLQTGHEPAGRPCQEGDAKDPQQPSSNRR